MKIIYTTIFIFLFAFCAFGQCSDESDCRAKLSTASQMVNKLLDVNKSQEQAIQALKEENAARQRKNDIDKGIIEAQDRLILFLEKQSKRQISILFGLLKVRF
jgi:spore cortex formation protein SpoVR/YcgB (stage V sporulation)